MLPSQKTDYSTQHAGKYYENRLFLDLKKNKDYSDGSYSKSHVLNALNISSKKKYWEKGMLFEEESTESHHNLDIIEWQIPR